MELHCLQHRLMARKVTEFHCHPANTFDAIARVKTMLPGNMESYEPLSVSQRSQLRRIILCISDTSAKLARTAVRQ